MAVVFWLVGFDIIYALQDYEFDRRHGLHSLVVRWGVEQRALGRGVLSHMIMWGILAAFGFLAGFPLGLLRRADLHSGLPAAGTLAGAAAQLELDQHAFFRLNAVISVVFLVVTLIEIVFPFMRFKS